MKNNRRITALLAIIILAFTFVLPVSASDDFDSVITSSTNIAPPTVSYTPPTANDTPPAEEIYVPTPEIKYTPDRSIVNDNISSDETVVVFTRDKNKAGSDTDKTISDKTNVAPPTVTVNPDKTKETSQKSEDSEKTNKPNNTGNTGNTGNNNNLGGVQGTDNTKPEPEPKADEPTKAGNGTIVEYDSTMTLPADKKEEVSKPPVITDISPDEKTTNVGKTITTATGTVEIKGIAFDDRAKEAIDLVNKERIAAGLKPLVYDSRLADATLLRALESSIYWSHTRPDGTDWYTVSGLVNGENLAKGYKTAEDAMTGWMNSKGHRENILRSNFTRISIVCVKTDNGYFWIQLFGV